MRKLTVVIAWDFIPGFTKLDTLLQFLSSTKLMLDEKLLETKYILALDQLNPRYKNRWHKLQFREFVTNLSVQFPELKVAIPDEWGHLAKNLENAFRMVSTEYVIVCQADLPFVEAIPISDLLPLPNEISHLLFNKNANPERIGGVAIGRIKVRGFTLLKTDIWSDNNHLCKTDYYKNVVFPLTRESCSFPETVMTKHKMLTKEDLGTFIYGDLGRKNVISHSGEEKRIFLFIERKLGNFIARSWYNCFSREKRDWTARVIRFIWFKYATVNLMRTKNQ